MFSAISSFCKFLWSPYGKGFQNIQEGFLSKEKIGFFCRICRVAFGALEFIPVFNHLLFYIDGKIFFQKRTVTILKPTISSTTKKVDALGPKVKPQPKSAPKPQSKPQPKPQSPKKPRVILPILTDTLLSPKKLSTKLKMEIERVPTEAELLVEAIDQADISKLIPFAEKGHLQAQVKLCEYYASINNCQNVADKALLKAFHVEGEKWVQRALSNESQLADKASSQLKWFLEEIKENIRLYTSFIPPTPTKIPQTPQRTNEEQTVPSSPERDPYSPQAIEELTAQAEQNDLHAQIQLLQYYSNEKLASFASVESDLYLVFSKGKKWGQQALLNVNQLKDGKEKYEIIKTIKFLLFKLDVNEQMHDADANRLAFENTAKNPANLEQRALLSKQQYLDALMLLKRRNQLEKDLTRGVDLLKKSAKLDNLDAINELISIYSIGIQGEERHPELLELLPGDYPRKPIKNSGYEPREILGKKVSEEEKQKGIIGKRSIKVPQSLKKAHQWASRAFTITSTNLSNNSGCPLTNKQHAEAMFSLAETSFNLKQHSEAFIYYKASAKAGNLNAMKKLTMMHLNDYAPENSLKETLEILAAAEKSYPNSEHEEIRCLRDALVKKT